MSKTLPMRYTLVKEEYTGLDMAQSCQSGKHNLMKEKKQQPQRRNNLENVRLSKGMTRPALAEKVGVTETTIYRKERGARGLSDKEAPQYAEALGVSVRELFNEAVAQYNQGDDKLREYEVGLMDGLKIIVVMLITNKIIDKSEFETMFTRQRDAYLKKGLKQAPIVMESLREFVSGKPRESEFLTMSRFLGRDPDGLV